MPARAIALVRPLAGAGRASCSGIGAGVLALWIVVFLAGGFASSKLSAILSNTFSVPGTAVRAGAPRPRSRTSATARTASFTVVFALPKGARDAAPAAQAAAHRRRRPRRAGRAGREAGELQPRDDAGRDDGRLRRHQLDAQPRRRRRATPTRCVARARHAGRASSSVYVTGAAAIQHDLDPVFNRDLQARRARDRRADRAARPARRLRALVGGDDPAHLRRPARSRARSGSSTASRASGRRRPTRRTSCS